jgi:hypothetical protein
MALIHYLRLILLLITTIIIVTITNILVFIILNVVLVLSYFSVKSWAPYHNNIKVRQSISFTTVYVSVIIYQYFSYLPSLDNGGGKKAGITLTLP